MRTTIPVIFGGYPPRTLHRANIIGPGRVDVSSNGIHLSLEFGRLNVVRCLLLAFFIVLGTVAATYAFGAAAFVVILMVIIILFLSETSSTFETGLMLGFVGLILTAIGRELVNPLLSKLVRDKPITDIAVDMAFFAIIFDERERKFYLRLNETSWVVFQIRPTESTPTVESTIQCFMLIDPSKVTKAAALKYEKRLVFFLWLCACFWGTPIAFIVTWVNVDEYVNSPSNIGMCP